LNLFQSLLKLEEEVMEEGVMVMVMEVAEAMVMGLLL